MWRPSYKEERYVEAFIYRGHLCGGLHIKRALMWRPSYKEGTYVDAFI
jgi:hypothetical protein